MDEKKGGQQGEERVCKTDSLRRIRAGSVSLCGDSRVPGIYLCRQCSDARCKYYKMVGNKTAVYISHRLASCRFCEDILVFDKGTVVQRGSHDDLLMQGGLYRQLWDAQAKYYA